MKQVDVLPSKNQAQVKPVNLKVNLYTAIECIVTR